VSRLTAWYGSRGCGKITAAAEVLRKASAALLHR